ncbi:hypothetical protein [Vibrio sp. CB1-14]|uniref:Uncharacterized protein n=1 Tax=Vibrio chaetopteri TaxID=3016528 RepID=A0AAU8BKN4_9VIBR
MEQYILAAKAKALGVTVERIYQVLEEDGSQYEPSSIISGSEIPALRKNGEREFYRFCGYVNRSDIDISHCTLVKLIGIVAYFNSHNQWTEFGSDTYIVGIYQHGTYRIVLSDDAPIVHNLSKNGDSQI